MTGEEMTGEELYQLYEEAKLRTSNCEVDPWAGIGEKEQNVWDALSDEVEVLLDQAARRGIL